MAEDNKPPKTILLIIAALVVSAVVVAALRKKPAAVPVVKVTREDISETITSNGKVEPVAPTVARAEFPTFVEKLTATEGEAVHRGQAILELDASDLRAQLAQAQASLLAAENELKNARAGGSPDEVAQVKASLQQARVDIASLERTQKALEPLVAKHAATQDELAQNQAALEKARSSLQQLEQRKDSLAQRAGLNAESANLMAEQAKEQVQSLEEKLRSATVIAPTGGTLYSLPVRAGDYVKVGDELAEMADLHQMRVRAFVDEPDLGRLEPNQNVQVTWDAKPGLIWKGRTQQIPKQVVPHGMRSVAEVLCSVDNGKLELLPSTNVEVTILLIERRRTLVVPRSAVREDAGKHYLFVFDGEKVHRREISVGIASASKYEVLSGISADDQIALPGDRDLKDGTEIRPVSVEGI
jgi:HlyD family secretion protein